MLDTRRTTALALGAAALTAAALTAAPAQASGGGDAVRTSGSCTGSTDWKLKAKADDGRIEVEAQVDSNRSGQTWGWKLKDNGDLVARGQSTTSGRSGSFSVTRKPADRSGTDHFTFRAVYPATGEVCRGTISW
jgi:hypothetical protein